MKRFFIAAAAVLAIFSCQKSEDVIVAPEKADKITVTPKSGDVTAEGGVVKVLVSSSADWTLAGKTDYSSWAVPSKLSGEDGDIVEFNVNPNETGNKLVAEWTFTCGKATETYILTSLPKVVIPDHLKLVSPAAAVVDYNEGRYELVVESSLHYRQLTATLSEGASEWLTYRATLEGDNKGEAKFVFDYKALSSLDDRTATITVSAEGVDPVTVTFTQEAKHRLEAVKSFISAKPAGETVAIPLIVNVAYKVEILQMERVGLSIRALLMVLIISQFQHLAVKSVRQPLPSLRLMHLPEKLRSLQQFSLLSRKLLSSGQQICTRTVSSLNGKALQLRNSEKHLRLQWSV